MKDKGEWSEITVRTPGWKATPDEIADFLRGVFPEDGIHRYQQRIAEAGMREAVSSLRTAFQEAVQRRGGVPKDIQVLFQMTMAMLDPEHENFDGFFPSKLVCPHHDPERAPAYHQMRPVMSPCPGVPRCNPGSGVRT